MKQLRVDDVPDVDDAVEDAGGQHQDADVLSAPHTGQRHVGLSVSEDISLNVRLGIMYICYKYTEKSAPTRSRVSPWDLLKVCA